jgi:uncharacterized protein YjfI (DUF2170 family)
VLVEIKGHKDKKENLRNQKELPLVMVALTCSKGEDLNPLETRVSKKSSLGIEAE